MEITFSDLRKICQSIQKNNENFFVDYLNSFEGNNIHEKFINILKDWEQDVSYTLNLNLNNKPTKITLNYLISSIPLTLGSGMEIKNQEFEVYLDIPKSFDTIVQETLPMYSIIQQINMFGIFIDLSDLSINERKNIIDNLPAKVYNKILKTIVNNNTKTVSFDNNSLDNFRFNFLTYEPYLFLKGLFNNFGEDYFRDIIFHLSKKIDGDLLMQSTPMDIEYYIQKFSEETQNQSSGLTI
jgi:hypothetical protein